MNQTIPVPGSSEVVAEPLLRSSAFGKQSRQYGRTLPFAESVTALDDLPAPYAAALRAALAGSEVTLRGLIHSPAFSTVAHSSPESVLALTAERWFLVTQAASGMDCQSGRFCDTALLELEMILLGGRLRVETLDGRARCTVGFNMVSVELFRAAAFLILAGAGVTTASQGAPQVDTRALSFKFQAALAEQLPPGQQLASVTTWERVLRPFAWLFFRRPAPPAGVLAITDRALCILSDPPDGKARQEKGKAPHGKIVVYLPLHAALSFRLLAAARPGGEETLQFSLPAQPELYRLRLPAGTAVAAALGKVLPAG
ncbi:hypothetical protein [Niveibacterium sp. SC-1]|uniref:hypothetical protein n=1 Tax=Niveibacterium sp. SC-1 TaxID=3135646 RepID=UPI00311F54FF